MELVEAQQPGPLGDVGGERRDRVVVALASLAVGALAPAMHGVVHVQHELVEMDPLLALHRRGLEEQIHQHGLAAADAAEQVQPLRRRVAPPGQPEPRPPAGDAGRRAIVGHRVVQALQLLHRQPLRRVGMQRAVADQRTKRGQRAF